MKRTPLARKSSPSPGKLKRGKGFSASKEQREKVLGRACAVTGRWGKVDPAHLVSRAMGGCDDPLCVVPLTREIHRQFDEGKLDLTSYLEPDYRAEIAHAVEHLGLLVTLRRLTGSRWVPVSESARTTGSRGVPASDKGEAADAD